MWLDLRELIEVPGAVKPFRTALDMSRLLGPSVAGFSAPPEAEGEVRNTAGVLDLTATIRTVARRVCDRCGTEFDRDVVMEVKAPLAADLEDADNFDGFALEGDGVDVSDVLETCFILNAESKCLCRPDCKGLCPVCGKNLNEGACACAKPMDPRFAVLGQLLDKNEEMKD